MNILHMKYAVEVAKVGSIRKAAELLFMAQPNLSRSIKELESDLGITIFDRSAKGMYLTEEGKEFISYAENALNKIDELESRYKTDSSEKLKFSVSVPRASYISYAFANFTKDIGLDPAKITYMETNSSAAINNVVSGTHKLGIIRYASNYHRYFIDMFHEKKLNYETVVEFRRVILMSSKCALSEKEELFTDDLSSMIEISHGDPFVPSVPSDVLLKEETEENISRKIFLYDRGSQFDLLINNPQTFMWVSPVPDNILSMYGLTQRSCEDECKLYRDVMIHRKDYFLTDTDKKFITELCMSKRKYL